MRVSKAYEGYLRHLRGSVPIREMSADPELEGIGLRHDVDYDIDTAVAMAEAEADAGCRSTYYLLHGTGYWNVDGFAEKCRSIEALGHEVGLHINVVADWFRGEIEDPETRLKTLLDELRATGVKVTGCAAHGDPTCYRGNFTNHWCLSEVRGENPEVREDGISAEGIKDDRKRFQIRYPSNHTLTRPDGRSLPLWTVSMNSLGLDHHAVHVPHDRYFSDSGGSWKRTSDPLDETFSGGRWQVLVHPEYWMAPPITLVSFSGDVPGREQLSDMEKSGFKIIRAPSGSGLPGSERAMLQQIQKQLPKRADSLVYDLPEADRALWTENKDVPENHPAPHLGDVLVLSSDSAILSPDHPELESLDISVPVTHGVEVGQAEEYFSLKFAAYRAVASRLIRAELRCVTNNGETLSTLTKTPGNWRICLEIEANAPGSALYLSPASADSVLCRAVTIPKGRNRITFRYGVLPGEEGFTLTFRTKPEFGGTIRIFGAWACRADDAFFAAEPVLERLEKLEAHPEWKPIEKVTSATWLCKLSYTVSKFGNSAFRFSKTKVLGLLRKVKGGGK